MARTRSISGSVTQGQHSFAQVPSVSIERSVFDRSCGVKTAFNTGYIVPVFVDEALPGDTFKLNTQAFGRIGAMVNPIMENLWMDWMFFAVPLRLVWDNFQKFMGEQDNPGDSTDFTIPQMVEPAVTGAAEGELSDYLGIPIGVPNLTHSALFHRAYNLIYNQWFRDENLVDSVVVDKDDGPDDPADYVLLKRGKRHDYFTSCLPFVQKGDPVGVPISGVPNHTGITVESLDTVGTTRTLYRQVGTGLIGSTLAVPGANTNIRFIDPGLQTFVNDLRESFQLQRLLERDARGGSRYVEILRSHFGVISPDQRLQRPEFLGGGTSRINVNPVAVTTQNTSRDLGDLGAFVTVGVDGIGFNKSFTEHCIILGVVSVRADLTYQYGLERMYSRSTRYDFYWPSLAHLGEQPVYNKEIWAQGIVGPTFDDGVFGYQERYAEYRYKPSRICGALRSTAGAPLHNWHLAQEFGSLPVLNQTFIEENVPMSRVLAFAAGPEILLDCYFNLRCARPMPTFSVPGLIDHF